MGVFKNEVKGVKEMKTIKTQQRYRCDFCKKTGTKYYMAIHEKRCFRNPNRYCDYCDNKGFTEESHEGIGIEKIDCPYCSKFDKNMLKEIEEREKLDH